MGIGLQGWGGGSGSGGGGRSQNYCPVRDDHYHDAMSGMDGAVCGACVRFVVVSQHAAVGGCRRHVSGGGPGYLTEILRDVIAHYCQFVAS